MEAADSPWCEARGGSPLEETSVYPRSTHRGQMCDGSICCPGLLEIVRDVSKLKRIALQVML